MRDFRNNSPFCANCAGKVPALLKTSSSEDLAWLGRWIVRSTEAGKSLFRFLARNRSASTPPAEVPMARMSQLAMPSPPQALVSNGSANSLVPWLCEDTAGALGQNGSCNLLMSLYAY